MSSQPRYSTSTDVGDKLNTSFSGATNPTQTQVEKMIDEADSYVDEISGHNWRLNYVSDEFYDAHGTGFKARTLILKNRPLVSVSKLEWHDGLAWVSGIERHPGASDIGPAQRVYYVYRPEGKIIWHSLSIEGRQRYRISYAWGYPVTPRFINDLSALLAAQKTLRFWAGKFMPAEEADAYNARIQFEIQRITWQIVHRVAGAVA